MSSRMQSTRLAWLNIAKRHALQNKKQSECMADCSRVYDNMYSDGGIFRNCFAQSAYRKGLACAFKCAQWECSALYTLEESRTESSAR